MVIAAADKRTPKCLYALARGCPVLTARWVADCAEACQLIPPTGRPKAHVLYPPNADLRRQPLFGGVRLMLHGGPKFKATFGAILAHAGKHGWLALILDAIGRVSVLGAACFGAVNGLYLQETCGTAAR